MLSGVLLAGDVYRLPPGRHLPSACQLTAASGLQKQKTGCQVLYRPTLLQSFSPSEALRRSDGEECVCLQLLFVVPCAGFVYPISSIVFTC